MRSAAMVTLLSVNCVRTLASSSSSRTTGPARCATRADASSVGLSPGIGCVTAIRPVPSEWSMAHGVEYRFNENALGQNVGWAGDARRHRQHEDPIIKSCAVPTYIDHG